MAAPQVLIDDAIRRQIMLEGVKSNEADKFLSFLKKMDIDLRERLTRDELTELSRSRMNKVLKEVKDSQAVIIAAYLSDFTTSLDDIAVNEAEIEAKALNKTVLEKGFETVIPTATQLITAYKLEPLSVRGKGQGLTLEPFLKSYTDDQINLITGKIAQGYAEGQTNSEIMMALRGTRAANFSDGVLAVVDRNTRTMVRTSVQNASSIARQKTWEDNSDIITGVQWVSTLDSRTTSQCQSLDGKIFPVDSGPRPPIHYGCRSTTVPVLADDLQYLEQGAKRPAKGEDADGDIDIKQVPSKTTYYEWIKTQPVDFQNKALGVTRAKLLRDGGLSVDEFSRLQLDKNFKPLTIKQMAKEAPNAFDQANLTI